MNVAASLQFSQELRICYNQQPGVTGKCRLNLVNVNLSSHSMRQDSWSLHLLSSVHLPMRPVSSRCNVLVCRSLLMPSGANAVPVLKSSAMYVKRMYADLCGSPVIIQLIPAVSIIAFAAWGLGPIMRLGRIIFIRKSDSNWKKSSTFHLMNAYLRPILFCAGATVICRVLDPVVLPSETSQAVKQRLLNFVRSISTVLAFASCFSSLIKQAQKFFMETNEVDAKNMGFDFAGKAVYSAVWIAAVSLFMELLGFSTQKWVTAGGLGTVLITLAGREILTNFLSSVMIHATRPFVPNEWIQTKIEGYEVSGTVEHVGWWSPTIIRGDDREAVHIPNHKFSVNVVRNLSQKTHWRIKTHFAVSHLDVNKINNIVADMRKVLAKNPQVEQQKLHRRVFLEDVNPENQALMILVSCFVKTSHFEEYLCVKEAILLDLLRVISHHRARLATPIRTVQKIYSEADLENVPFSDTMFTRSGGATNRPLLLIEPSYKVSDEDKPKASSITAHTNEEKDSKVDETLTSGSQASTLSGPASIIDSKESKVTGSSASSSSSEGTSSHPPNGTMVPDSLKGSFKELSNEKRGETLKETFSVPEKPVVDNLQSGSEKVDVPVATSQVKPHVDRSVALPSVARPPLEDNIVLEVALEGSKRTLPIEEEVSAEELAAHQSGSPSGKDKKDDQMPLVPGASQND